MQQESDVTEPVSLFYVYASEDKSYSNELDKHLNILRRQGLITEWHNREVSQRQEKADGVDEYSNTAHIILLLISPDFCAADYYDSTELQHILERSKAGGAIVISVLLRPTDLWGTTLLDGLVLPPNREPITLWANRDMAFLDIAQGIRKALQPLKSEQLDQDEREPAGEKTTELRLERTNTDPLNLFCSYAPEDEAFYQQLKNHLTALQYTGIIQWNDFKAGEIWSDYIDHSIDTAQIILLLISTDFFNSTGCYHSMQRALERYAAQEAIVIPIILRPTLWEDMPIGTLAALPTDGKPIITWTDQDEAFLNIVEGIRAIIAVPLSYVPLNEGKSEKNIPAITLQSEQAITAPIKLFYSSVYYDQQLLERLRIHLAPLRWDNSIYELYYGRLVAGEPFSRQKQWLNEAQIILLLISPEFIASEETYEDAKRAVKQYTAGKALVYPIILRPVDWKSTVIGRLEPLPTEGKPVTLWASIDEAFLDIAQHIRSAVLGLLTPPEKTKEQWLLEGKDYYNAQRYEEALTAYQAALHLDPDDALVADRTGRILLQLGRYEEALAIYEPLARASSSPSVHLNKGLVLQRLGRSVEALDAYRKAHVYGYSG